MTIRKGYGEWTGKAEIRTKKNILTLIKHTWLHADLLHAFKGEHSSVLGFRTEGTLIFLRPQYAITRTHLRQREKLETHQTFQTMHNIYK